MSAPKQKRLRGWQLEKEMIAPAQSASSARQAESALATKLLYLWASGYLAATVIRELAHLATLDGASHPELVTMAKAGNFGQSPGNAHRDILRAFCKAVEVAEDIQVPVQCIDPKTSLQEESVSSIFLPHLMFWALATQYAEQFAKLFSTADLEAFWRAAEKTGDDRFSGHPMKSNKNWRQKCIPLFLHGDGVEYHERDSLLVWSWGCILSLLSSLDCHLLIANFPKSCTCQETWPNLMKWVVWSFKALLAGFHPSLGPNEEPLEPNSLMHSLKGQPLSPGRFKGVLWCIQGDHEFFSNVLHLPHWNNDMPCWECDCVNADHPTKSVRILQPALASWTYVDTQAAAANPRSRHLIFSIPGVTTRLVRGDGLHIVFTKGIYGRLMGSVLHRLCWNEKPGSHQRVAPAQRLAIIFAMVQSLYRDAQAPTRLTNLKLSMFIADEKKPHVTHPSLKSKAAESKHLAPALLQVCKDMLDNSDPLDQHIVEALDNICTLMELFDQAPAVLTSEEHSLAMSLAESFLDNYAWLNKWAIDNERMLFHYTIKFHTFWHLIQNSQFLNPRYHWCFKSEDFVGKVSRLAMSVSMGTKSTKISTKIAPKYRILLHLRLTRAGFAESQD